MMAKRKSKSMPSRSTRKAKMSRQMRLDKALDEIEMSSRTQFNFGMDDAWMIYRENGFSDGEIREMYLKGSFGRKATPTRKIDGKNFMQIGTTSDRKAADSLARMQRQKMGRNARVISNKNGYGVWVSPSVRYNSETTRMSLLDRVAEAERRSSTSEASKKKRRRWFNFGRRRKKPMIRQMTTQEELDQQELQSFYAFKDKLIKDGLKEEEAFLKAKKAAEFERKEREAKIQLQKEKEKIDQQLRVAREREEIAEYRQGLADYKQGVPLSTVAKYNALEITTTSTGAVVGGVVAGATAVAAFPLIPVAALSGFFAAKAIRNNVFNIGLKQGVNNTLDAVDRGTTGLTEVVRVSKDSGQPNWRTLGLLREPKRKKPAKPIRLQEIEKEQKRKAKIAERKKRRKIRKELKNKS